MMAVLNANLTFRAYKFKRHWMAAVTLLLSSMGFQGVALAAGASKAAELDLDPVSVLTAIQQAARKLDYSGVFIYQQGDLVQSSRLIHVVDGTGERERLEILDGLPREYLRHNDDVQCLMPESKTVLLERRKGDRFPSLLLGDPSQLKNHYALRVDPVMQRVAGRRCRMISIEPSDKLRYGYRLCVDTETNLLLKAQTLNLAHAVIEQVSFSSLQIGSEVDSRLLSSRWPAQDWKVHESALTPVDLQGQGWRIPAPAGFSPVMQMSRAMAHGGPVSQLVLSDGLATISVFIEPYDAKRSYPLNGHGKHGAVNVYGKRIADFWLMAVGEVPTLTLERLAAGTEYVPVQNAK